MRKFNLQFIGLWLFILMPVLVAQEARENLNVPMVDPEAITLDGNMDEPEWGSAAQVNLVTNTGYNIWTNYYDRDGLAEPEYDEYFARLLWAKDTLYAFIQIDEIVNDSSGLYWDGQWVGDQLFVSLSNRLATDLADDSVNYDGNVYAVPDGPYHYLIMGDQITLNNGALTYIPVEYRSDCEADSQLVFDASEWARWAVTIDEETGVWTLEMAIYNPHIASQSAIAFNLGGSQGSATHDPDAGDGYMYYTWLPNVPNDPFTNPTGENDPGFYNLVTSEYWAILNFVDGDDKRLEMEVPMVDPESITLDGNMNESEWENAAQVNLVTNTGYNIWTNYYDRDGLAEPEYDEYFARLLWAEDTLYAFIHVNEIVNDSSGLYWDGQWVGDQLFVSLSNRLGIDLADDSVNYDGNVYAVPDGPYHYLIMGDQVTLNADAPTYIPFEWRRCVDESDSQKVFMASDWARWGVSIDEETGEWNIEMAIYNPNVAAEGRVGFNLGGSQGSATHDPDAGDGYMYYTWQPNVPNDPFSNPTGENDPGFYNLVTSEYWAVLNFVSGPVSVERDDVSGVVPQKFSLHQNYPNPFNPTTKIRFDVANNSPVTLKVYNVMGELVSTLVNSQVFGAGTYSVTWDASNLASGIYFYRLEADGVVNTMKMLLLK